MIDWADLETPLVQEPRFFVQAPDGRRDWPEIDRQATLFRVMREAAPRVKGLPVPNAGKRNPRMARKENIRAGVFDTLWFDSHPRFAAIELKGYDKSGRAGKLSPQQVEWGNSMLDRGWAVACFFDPYAAVDWLREQGLSVGEVSR